MKNRKGFTLVELIAVILIVGVVSTIGVLSYTSISRSINEKEKQNILNKIGIVGKRYCEEKEVEEVYVKTLISEGYIASSNGKIVNPDDERELLNCYVYNAITGEITLPEENDAKSLECKAAISDGVIKIKKCANGDCTKPEEIDYTKWYNDTDLKLAVTSDKVNLREAEYRWINFLDPSKEYKEKEFVIDLRNIKTVEGQIRVLVTSEGKTYKAETAIKVDTKAPVINSVSYDNTKWEPNKKIKIELIDDDSGLSEYSIKEVNTGKKGITKIEGKKYNNEITIEENGTYQICVKDKAGNENCKDTNGNDVRIVIDKIDNIKPTCSISKTSTGTTSGVSAKITCSDGQTGITSCNGVSSTSTTVSGVKTTTTYKVVDKAGNEGTCSLSVSSQIQKRTRSWNDCLTGSKNTCVGGYYDPYNCKGSCKSTSYNTCQSSACGCASSSYYSCRTSGCGCETYQKCPSGYTYFGTRGPSCGNAGHQYVGVGCETWKSCKNSACGSYCVSYASCATSACGSYCSSYYYNASCGNTAYDSCLSTKNTCSGGWNSWGSWSNASSCSSSDSVDCRTLYS